MNIIDNIKCTDCGGCELSVCYQTCILEPGTNNRIYRRTGVFGGGDNIQSQGMNAFTGSHPLYNQPWLGNSRGGLVTSTGAGHFFDRGAGSNARERLAHEAYIAIPNECVADVDQIRFLSLGEQFAQVRVSGAGGDLNNATVVGQVSYLGPPNTRQIGGVVNVNQNEIYGVLAYVLDRQDNADIRIQYRATGGAWINMPTTWLYPDIADAQTVVDKIKWCSKNGIATNEIDNRRISVDELINDLNAAEIPCYESGEVVTATTSFTTTNGVVITVGDSYIQFPNGNTWSSDSSDLDEQVLSTIEVSGVTTGLSISNGNTVPINHPPETPEQEICTGDFVDVTGRTGWLHTWTPIYSASTGTIVEDWRQVSTTETSPNCETDITVNVSLGNSYIQTRNMWGRVWYDVRLLVNGAAVSTYTFQNYHYEDNIGEDRLTDDLIPLGSAFFARPSVPAGSTIAVEILRRHNFVAGSTQGNAATPFGRVISGLRAHFNVHYSPINIVTGRL